MLIRSTLLNRNFRRLPYTFFSFQRHCSRTNGSHGSVRWSRLCPILPRDRTSLPRSIRRRPKETGNCERTRLSEFFQISGFSSTSSQLSSVSLRTTLLTLRQRKTQVETESSKSTEQDSWAAPESFSMPSRAVRQSFVLIRIVLLNRNVWLPHSSRLISTLVTSKKRNRN